MNFDCAGLPPKCVCVCPRSEPNLGRDIHHHHHHHHHQHHHHHHSPSTSPSPFSTSSSSTFSHPLHLPHYHSHHHHQHRHHHPPPFHPVDGCPGTVITDRAPLSAVKTSCPQMSAAVAVSGGDSERTRSQKSCSCVALFRLSCLVFRKTYLSSPSSATSPLSSTSSSSSLKCFILLLPPYCLWPLAGIIFLHQIWKFKSNSLRPCFG